MTVQHSHRDFPIQSESFATYTNNALIGIKDTFKISQNFNNFKMFTKLHPWKVKSFHTTVALWRMLYCLLVSVVGWVAVVDVTVKAERADQDTGMETNQLLPCTAASTRLTRQHRRSEVRQIMDSGLATLGHFGGKLRNFKTIWTSEL